MANKKWYEGAYIFNRDPDWNGQINMNTDKETISRISVKPSRHTRVL